jgi:hypothetical protein
VRHEMENLLDAVLVAEGRLRGLSVVTSTERRRLAYPRLQFLRVIEAIDATADTKTEAVHRSAASFLAKQQA